MRTFSSLRGRVVETESGRRLGRCYDLEAVVGRSSATVKAMAVGRRGRLEHLGIGRRHPRDAVAWDAVVRIEGKRIVVRDGTELQ